MTLRLLYIIDSLGRGGAEKSLAALASPFEARDVELQVAYLRERSGVRVDLERAGVQVTALTGSGGRPRAVRRTIGLIQSCRPHLVHTTLYEANVAGRVASRLARVPVVSSLVNEVYGPEHTSNPGLRRWKLRTAQLADAATARCTVRMHAVSNAVADAMSRRLRYPRDRIDVVPRGRDPVTLGTNTIERRDRARRALGLSDGDRMILAVARQDHQKGLDVLVSGFTAIRQAMPRAALLVAGREGEHSGVLRELIAQFRLGTAVRLLGQRDDVGELLCAADVFAMPSRREGSPGALLEAMALEVPVVVSDIAATREVVDESCARMVRPNDSGALAQAVVEALGHPQSSAARATVARQRFLDRFTIDRAADGMVEFYDRALTLS